MQGQVKQLGQGEIAPPSNEQPMGRQEHIAHGATLKEQLVGIESRQTRTMRHLSELQKTLHILLKNASAEATYRLQQKMAADQVAPVPSEQGTKSALDSTSPQLDVAAPVPQQISPAKEDSAEHSEPQAEQFLVEANQNIQSQPPYVTSDEINNLEDSLELKLEALTTDKKMATIEEIQNNLIFKNDAITALQNRIQALEAALAQPTIAEDDQLLLAPVSVNGTVDGKNTAWTLMAALAQPTFAEDDHLLLPPIHRGGTVDDKDMTLNPSREDTSGTKPEAPAELSQYVVIQNTEEDAQVIALVGKTSKSLLSAALDGTLGPALNASGRIPSGSAT